MKFKVFLLAGAAALAAVAMACGDDDDPKTADSPSGGDSAQDGGAAGGGLTLPNTWMEYNGEQRQLTNILFEGVDVDADEFTKVGKVDSIDIEGTTGEVFQRAGDVDAFWTYAPAGDSDDEEPNAMWHRWATPPSGGEAAAS